MSPKIVPILNSAPNLLFALPLLLLTRRAYKQVFDGTNPPEYEWDFLWDDAGNFHQNPHVVSGLSWTNVAWALRDGTVHSVYEPVSLIIKMALHSLVEFDARTYRVVNFYAHCVNVYLVFAAGRELLIAANDYDYHAERVRVAMVRTGKRTAEPNGDGGVKSGAAASCADGRIRNGGAGGAAARNRGGRGKGGDGTDSGSNARARRAGGGKEGEDAAAAAAAAAAEDLKTAGLHPSNANETLRNLDVHQCLGTVGCLVGTALFAVHPLQAQSVGWASCMSYFFACTFSLLSFRLFVLHRTSLREFRRRRRRLSTERSSGCDASSEKKSNLYSAAAAAEPWRIIRSGMQGRGKGRGAGTGDDVDADEPETWLLTRHKVGALICYVLATFCKAPAIVLPVVFVIVDVYVWSAPLSVHPMGESILNGALQKQQQQHHTQTMSAKSTKRPSSSSSAAAASNGSGGASLLHPHRVATKFVRDDLPKLWRLAIRAISAHAIFFLATPVMVAVILGSNAKARPDGLGAVQKVEKAALALGWYVAKTFVPTGLCAAVELRSVSVLDHWEVAASLVLVPAATVLLLAHSLSSTPWRLAACAWGSAVALLFPALGFVQHAGNMVYAADRYMYIPLAMLSPIGGAVACGWFTTAASAAPPPRGVIYETLWAGGPVPASVTDAAAAASPIDGFDSSCVAAMLEDGKGATKRGGKKSKSAKSSESSSRCASKTFNVAVTTQGWAFAPIAILSLLATVVVLLVFATSVTPANLTYWRNTKLLWERNLEIYPDSLNAHVPLANFYSKVLKPPDLDNALFHSASAVRLSGGLYENRFNLGAIHLQREEYDEAVGIFRSLLREDHRHKLVPRMVVDLAIALHQIGEWDAAVRELEQAVKMREPRAKDALETIMKQREDPDAERRQRERWQKTKQGRQRETFGGP